MVLSTEWSQVEVIDLVNDGNGLGFILVGGRSTGVVIKALTPGGVAERDGRLQCGDHLLQIGEVNLRGFSSEQVATVLRQTGAQVRLIVARPVEPAATDFQALASHAPIIPTKLLSDPEELSRHLFQNPSFATSTTAAIAGAISPGGGGSAGTGGSGGGIGSGSGGGGGMEASVGSGLCCFLPTPDAELADLPLPPIPGDVPASAARICPKDLDIVPFSIVSPPPTLSPLPLSRAAVTPPPSSSQTRSSNMDHIVTVIAGLSAGTPKDAYALDDDGQHERERRGSTTSSSDYNIDSPETETYEVTLYKNVYGLGITVAGYVCEEEDLSGIFVKSIIEGSAAEMSRQIQINDRIVAVDGRTLAGVTNHQAVELLRNTDIEVQLTLERFLRGRKFEHLQVALTELKGGIHDSGEGVDTQSQSSLPASPSIATLSWFPPKSDADSIATDGGCGGGVSGALVIMDFGDLPSRETVDSNMSHMLDRSERSERSEHSTGGAITPSAKLQRTPATPDKHLLLLTNGNAVQFNGNGLPHDEDENGDEDDVEHSEDELESLQQPNGGAKTPTNENVITTATVPQPIASPTTATATSAISPITTATATANATKVNVLNAAAAAAPAPAPTPSAESLKVTWKSEFPECEIIVAEINKLSGLGISLEGTVDVECGIEKRPHHYIRSILEDGPVGRQGILRPGDELLQVNEYKLQGLKHIEVVKILKELPTHVKLVCARGPMAPSIINTSQNPEAFETRSLLPGGHQSLQNLMTKAQSESSLYTSSTATLTDQQRSKSLENVSGLALWSSDVTTIEIEKTEQGFGFSILDYQDPLDAEGSVIVIRGLIRGGSAEATNEIFPGDRLVSVGEHSLHGLDLDEAVAILKGMPLGVTKLGICRPLSTSDSNIASPVEDAGDSPST